MIFLDPWFWKFAVLAVTGYWLCPAVLKRIWLLAASLVFQYEFAGPAGMLPIILLSALTYGTGLLLSVRRDSRALALAFAAVIGALIFYKYAAFLVATVVGPVAGWIAPERVQALLEWRSPAAPLAISFFTFEFVHYLYEVGVRRVAPVRSVVDFALFATFFPTLASGPIKRFPDFVPQLAQLRNPNAGQIWSAARRVVLGLFKKICIADLLVEPIRVLEKSPEWSASVVVGLAVLQGARIYYDFSGYTDIAVGFAQMLGLRVPENFDRPYRATSLQDFWRRWHMSLTSWIRDYVYIPMGGNRRRAAVNLIAALVICGLWHGAAWNFALWGLYHGAGLAFEAGVRARLPRLFAPKGPRAFVRWSVCYGFVSYGWLLFFYPIDTVIEMTREALRCGFGG